MPEDKFAPKPNDGIDKVHNLHWELIKQQQNDAKKARELSAKPKAVPALPSGPDAEKAEPTQPPAVDAPLNADAPQNQPAEVVTTVP